MALVVGSRIGLTTYTLGSDPRPGRAQHNAERDLLESVVVVGDQGSAALRPTSGKGKSLYWDTDRGVLQWDTGTAWQDITTNGGGGAPTTVAIGGTTVEGTSARSARADHVHTIALVTTTAPGAMSAADKVKLDGATAAATGSTLVLRDANGRIQVMSPSLSADAATKGYVDSVVGGAAAPVVSYTDNGLATPAMLVNSDKVRDAVSGVTASRMVIRDAAGRAQFAEPSLSADASSKGYVDSQISSHRHDATHITTGTIAAARLPLVTTLAHGAMSNTDKSKLDGATAVSTGNTLVLRNADGVFAVGTPTLGAHAVHKTYVDNGLSGKANNGHTHDAVEIATGTLSTSRLPYASGAADGVISSTTYNTIYNHSHDAGAITSGVIGAARLPTATNAAQGAMSAGDKAKLDAATSLVNVNAIVTRDAAGRAGFAAPAISSDAATKGYVDGKTWDATRITSGFFDYDRTWGSKHAYNTAWNGDSVNNPVRDVFVTAGGEFCYTSSTMRHKTNETPWTPDPRALLAPEVLEYNRLDPATGEMSPSREIGVYAERAGEHVPEFVEIGPDRVGDTEFRVQGWSYARWTNAHQVLHQWTARRDDTQDARLDRIEKALGLTPISEETGQ